MGRRGRPRKVIEQKQSPAAIENGANFDCNQTQSQNWDSCSKQNVGEDEGSSEHAPLSLNAPNFTATEGEAGQSIGKRTKASIGNAVDGSAESKQKIQRIEPRQQHLLWPR